MASYSRETIDRVRRTKGGCGCAIAVLVLFLGALAFVGYKFVLPWWQKQPPAASGKDLRIVVHDVGQGDSILIIGPEKVALIDVGDEKNGKKVVESLKAKGVEKIDYLIATHSHPDHIGGAPEVLANFKVGMVLHNDVPPPEVVAAAEAANAAKSGEKQPGRKPAARPAPKRGKPVELPTVKAYNGFKSAIERAGTEFKKAELEQKIDLGGGAILTVLGPIPPLFTRDQIASSRKGNELNANSIVMRLDYGDFSMLLTGDAEEQSEERLLNKEDTPLPVTVLKVSHHGSRYATSENFVKRVFPADSAEPKVAIISLSEFNRYSHPHQDVLNRLKAAGVKELYRTDLQGEIMITTTGKRKNGKLYEIAAKEPKSDIWAGRVGEKNDTTSSGFIAYGDYGPPPRQRSRK